MRRVEEVRIQLKNLLDTVPFRPFIIRLENGEQVRVEHPENIAYSLTTPAPPPTPAPSMPAGTGGRSRADTPGTRAGTAASRGTATARVRTAICRRRTC